MARCWAKPEWFFAVVASVVLVVLSVLTPAGANHDEFTHVMRVEQICSGQFDPMFLWYNESYPQTTEKERAESAVYGGVSDENLYRVTYDNNVRYQTDREQYAFPTWSDPNSLSDLHYGDAGSDRKVFSNTAINSPVVYLPYVPGFLLGRAMNLPIYWIVALMRLLASAFYVIVTFWCISVVPCFRWPVAIYCLLPNQLAGVAGVTADTMTNVLFTLYICLLLALVCREGEPRKAEVGALMAATVFLPLAKIVYYPTIFLVFLAFVINRDLRERWLMLSCLGAVALGSLLLLLWYRKIGGINTGAMWLQGISPSKQLQGILGDIPLYIKRLIIHLPFYDFFQIESYGVYGEIGEFVLKNYDLTREWLPFVALAGSLALVDERDRLPEGVLRWRWLLVLVLSGMALMLAVLVITAIYLTFCSVGADTFKGVQGRYFIPVGLTLLIAMAFLTSPVERNARWSEPNGENALPGTNGLADGWRNGALQAVTCGAIILVELTLLIFFRFTVFL